MNRRYLAGAGLLLALAATSAGAQSVLLREGTTVRTIVGPSTKVAIPIVIDLSAGAGTNVSALTTSLTWSTARLTYDSVTSGNFGSLTPNETNASSGSLLLSLFDANGTTTTKTMATVYFTASATVGGTHVALNPTVAGDQNGSDILSRFRLQHLDVCVANMGLYGDVNVDASVNIIDAQQIARYSVSLSVANLAAVQASGDVTADNNVNIIDAQQIARFSVGLSAAARVNTTYSTAPAVSTVTVAPNAATLNPGAATQLVATPVDGSSLQLFGCNPVAWSTNAAGNATVDSTGRVVAVASGSATITATIATKTGSSAITIASAGAPATLTLLAGDQQYAFTSSAAPVSPKVLVKDANNVPVPNVPVTFTVSGGTFNGGNPSVVNTDVNGTAVATSWTPSSSGSTASMTASIGGGVPNVVATVNLVGSGTIQTTCIDDGFSQRCWGSGTRGQLGNGTFSSSTTPVNVSVGSTGMKIVTRTNFGDHFCGLNSSGAAYCWGWNAGGQLGDGTRTDRNVPTAVIGGLTFTSLAAGGVHTCGVTTAGDVYCWGINVFGQLGDSTIGTSRTAPTKVKTPAGLVFTSVTAGSTSTCATTAAGEAYCWGNNANGQLGIGNTVSPQIAPVHVAGSVKFPKISIAPWGGCGLTAAGAAYCWGSNVNNSIGDGTAVNSSSPVAVVGGHVFAEITAGASRACGEKTALNQYTIWCWGFGGGGFGDGNAVNHPTPTPLPITGTKMFVSSLSQGTTCVLGVGGNLVFCWGNNSGGQLGDGTTSAANEPEPVGKATADASPAAIGEADGTKVIQSAPAGTAVPVVPAVVVGSGVPAILSGVTVNWQVLSGGGSVTNSTSVTTETGASSGGWTLGPTVGEQLLQATVTGITVNGVPTGPLRFTFIAYGTAAPASIAKVLGDNTYSLVNTNGGGFFVPQTVLVKDGSNNPIANTAVAFQVGANSGTISGNTDPITILTDANGLATLPNGEWSVNTNAGAISTLTATAAGLAPVTFTHTRVNSVFSLAACELSNAGAVLCAGSNTNGALGDNTTTTRSTFAPVSGGIVFASLAEGVSNHHCGLTSAGVAYCWGQNQMGQLGDGSFTDRLVPTLVGGGLTFSKIYTFMTTTCALTTSNVAYCWGFMGTGGWGGGDSQRASRANVPTALVTGGRTFIKLAPLDDGVCGITASGIIACLARGSQGANADGATDQRTGFVQWPGAWSELAAGNGNICALDTGGAAYCVGSDQQGALGIGLNATGGTRSTPQQVIGGVTFTKLTMGNFRVCGLRVSGDVWCWGIQPGNGQTASDRPAQVPGLTATSVRVTTFRNACAKIASGALYCWGTQAGAAGYTGDGTTIDRYSPVAVLNWPDGSAAGTAASMTLTTAAQIALPVSTATTPASVTVKDRQGNPVSGITVTFSASAGTVTGGTQVTNASGVATIGSWTLPATSGTASLSISAPGIPIVVVQATVVPPAANFTASTAQSLWVADNLTTYQANSVLVTDASGSPIASYPVTFTVSTGTVNGASSTQIATGTNGIATLGTGTWASVPTTAGAYTVTASSPGGLPNVVFTLNRVSAFNNSANNPGTTACRNNASNTTLCWGSNTKGAVGDATTTNRAAPTAIAGGQTFTKLSEGFNGWHQCGLTASGAAYCWGDNEMGQLGDNSQTNRSTPTLVSGALTFSSIYTGTFSTCGITTSNALYCWGSGGLSLRGDGVLEDIKLVPTLVNTGGNTLTSLALSYRGACGLDNTGRAFCWGANGSGQGGLGSTSTFITSATAVNTSLKFTKLVAGSDSFCGLVTDSSVACWGINGNGQMGNGGTANQTSPTFVGSMSGVLEIKGGEGHYCARTATDVYCWGQNGSGQVGDGTTTNKLSPVLVASGITPVAFGSFSRLVSCVLTSTQEYCWGFSGGGIGDNTTSGRTTPTAIRWPETSATSPATITAQTSVSFSAAAGVGNTVTVKVTNNLGAAIPNVGVSFVITAGGGGVTVANGSTDANGLLSTSWTLAGASATVNKLEARVSGVPTIQFTGTVP